jgi:hypothetical protein
MTNNKIDIHVSDVKTFLQCRRLWDFSSNLRQGLERKVTYSPFFLGRMVHWCLQVYYEGEYQTPLAAMPTFLEGEIQQLESVGRLWEQEKDIINEAVELASGMLQHYTLWQSTQTGTWSDQNLDFISLETQFNVPLITPSGRASTKVNLAGRFDGIVRRRDNGTLWLWETKTAQSIDRLLTSLDNEFQPGVYLMAAEQLLGEQISGVLYNILRKKIPTQPRLLQRGVLSQDKTIDTTLEIYAQAIRETHPDWTKDERLEVYGEMLNFLAQKGNTFFLRQPFRRTPAEMDNLRRDIHLISLEMSRPDVHIYPHPNWAYCGRCAFRSPCLGMNQGMDISRLLESEYQSRRIWDATEGEEFNGKES